MSMSFFLNEKTQNYFLGMLYLIDALAIYTDSRLLIYLFTGVILVLQTISLIETVRNPQKKSISQMEENRFSSLVYRAGLVLFAAAILIHAYL